MTTFLDLTNRLLRRMNDVEISQSDFASAKNIQGSAKDAVLDTVRKINGYRSEWPFNAMEHSQTLAQGVEEYAWPLNFVSADWDSFQIQKDEALNINNRKLFPISREEWYDRLRDLDYDTTTDGKNVPEFVFPSHGQGFGISPSPNKAYTLKFRYYRTPTDLSAYSDEPTIPSKFDYVILDGALHLMKLWKNDTEQAAFFRDQFDRGVKDMIRVYIPSDAYIYDGRVNFGGGTGSSVGYYWGI